MKVKVLLCFGILAAAFLVSPELLAQNAVVPPDRAARLQALSESLRGRDAADRREAMEFARKAGIPTRRDLPAGGVMELQRIHPGTGPVFYITNNIDAADTVSTDEVWPGGSAGLNLDGSGMTVGEWDGGAVRADHPDFEGRLTQVDGVLTVSNHSTHVGGTLIGAGDIRPEARGMAYAGHLDAYDWNSDTAEMAAAAAAGLLVSNHSYGIAAGWLYIGDAPPDGWWWIGGEDPSIVEDYKFGYYDSEAALWDQIAFDAPWYLIVKASGNDRSDTGPAPGEEYTIVDENGGFITTSTAPRDPDCAPAGYDCLPGHSVAKNILTIGAVDDLVGGYSPLAGPTQVSMLEFSSWGPTDDGRIKPDVVGNGMLLISAWGEDPWWVAAIGTSMATPNVTGSLLLLQQHYQNLHGPGNFMRAATLKALAIHTADEAGAADGPDYEYGWGLLNTKTAAQVISGDGGSDHRIIEGSLANGATDTFSFSLPADSILKVTLVWADPPGTPVAPSLDPPDLMLVNDLDLRVRKDSAVYLPWVLDPAAPAAAAAHGDNFRDNVEQVVADGGGAGTYFIDVSHKGTLLDGASQDYSLIISVVPAPPTNSTLAISEDFSGGLPAGWFVDTVSGIDWTINSPVPGDSRLDNNTGGSGNFAMVDNNYSHITLTSLRTNALDLSDKTDVVLHFKSYFYMDGWETINVDVSTDGGSAWTNAWTWSGFNPFPTPYVVDLTSLAAGQPSVELRFRFDSLGEIMGNLWQIDDVELEVFGGTPPPPDPPGAATGPSPADGATDVAVDALISWTAGSGADTHDVYFGTASPPPFQGNQGATSFDPGPLSEGTNYFWRIDEVNGGGTTAGSEWSFTTVAAPPPPADTAVHLKSLAASSVPGARNRWTATVDIEVVDNAGLPAANVVADGTWSAGASGGASCTTDATGHCTVSKNNLKPNVASVVFTVTNLSGTGFVYDSAANETANAATVYKDAPPSGGGFVLTVSSSKVKGITQADLAWSGGVGTGTVTISRNGTVIAAGEANDGAYSDPLGRKPTGAYTYQVCEADSGYCASDSIQF